MINALFEFYIALKFSQDQLSVDRITFRNENLQNNSAADKEISLLFTKQPVCDMEVTYITSQGTIQLRTTLLSTISEQGFDLTEMISHYNNPKLSAMVKDHKIPVRSLTELSIASEFVKRFDSYIFYIHFTGDTIKFETKKNPFQDVQCGFYGTENSSNSTRTFDVKSGNFAKGEYFKGEIRQITLDDGQIIWYPNKPIDLKEQHYIGLTSRLKSDTFLKEAAMRMDEKQFDYLRTIVSVPYVKVQKTTNYQDVENILMDIQTLSTFPKAFNFVNIYHISNRALTPKELEFINQMSKYVNPYILNNPRNMQQFCIKALNIYRTTYDVHVFKTMKPLQTSQTWLSTELDKVGTDIFTSS